MNYFYCSLILTVALEISMVSAYCGDKFKCSDGSCVDISKMCDGRRDCHDYSDETMTDCRGIHRDFASIKLECIRIFPTHPIASDVCPGSCTPLRFISCGISFLNLMHEQPTRRPRKQPCHVKQIRHGEVSLDSDYDQQAKMADHGTTATFSCEEDYQLSGAYEAECQYGSWSRAFPICERVTPREPPCQVKNIPNGVVSATANRAYNYETMMADHGTTVRFTCNEGYQLSGAAQTYCLSGSWINEFPTCKPILQPCRMESVPNGAVSADGAYDQQTKMAAHGATARFTCDAGYQLTGAARAVCQSGSWSSAFPTCERVSRQESCRMENITNGVVSADRAYDRHTMMAEHGTAVRFSCDQGYVLSGADKSLCQSGSWFNAFPTCGLPYLDVRSNQDKRSEEH